MRSVALASHHFLLICQMKECFQLEKGKPRQKHQMRDYSTLQELNIAVNFQQRFQHHMTTISHPRNIDEEMMDINSAMQAATWEVIPVKVAHKAKPWISSITLSMIDERNLKRQRGDIEGERALLS